MFTCPTDEIHSLYLDNELPQNYVESYEAHIASCDKCRARLEKLKLLHEAFSSDASDITPDKEFLDKSYERLMLKMKYSKNAGRSYKRMSRGWKIAIPAIAAAAVLATVIPIGINSGNRGVRTMSATSSLYSQMPSPVSEQLAEVSYGAENGFAFNNSMQSVLPTNVSNNTAVSSRDAATKLLKDLEVFPPKFEGESKTISIRITVPGDDDVPVTTEIELPLDVTGQQ